jgi:hypothetical protein
VILLKGCDRIFFLISVTACYKITGRSAGLEPPHLALARRPFPQRGEGNKIQPSLPLPPLGGEGPGVRDYFIADGTVISYRWVKYGRFWKITAQCELVKMSGTA